MSSQPAYSRLEIVLLLAAFTVALPGAIRWLELGGTEQHDMAGYYIAASRVAKGDNAIYATWPGNDPPHDVPAADLGLPYNYPPLLAVLMIPLAATLTYAQAQAVWLPLNIGMAITAVWLGIRALDVPINRREWLGIALAVFLFPPLFRTVRIGQIVCLLMLCSAIALWGSVKKRHVWVGICVALAALIKIYPAVFGAMLAIRREWRSSLWAVVVGLAFILVPIVIIGADVYRSYVFDRLPAIVDEPLTSPANQSLSSFLVRLDLGGTLLLVSTVALSVGILAATFIRIYQHSDWLIVTALATVPALLLPNRSWDFNYLMLLVPMVALFFSPTTKRYGSRSVVLAAYILIVLERYWSLYPAWWPLQSFSVYGALLLWLWLIRLPPLADTATA